ncbi:hypothetical protein D3C79_784660 [compost metagenome]
MGGVDLDYLEARLQCPFGGFDKLGYNILDLVFAQLTRRRVFRVEGNLRRPHRLPATFLDLDAAMLAQPRAMGAGLAPGVGQLDARHGALRGDEAGDALQWGDLFIVPQTKVLGSDPAIGGHSNRFGDDQPGTTDGAATQMDKVPVVGQAIDGGILAHRRNGDAVGQGQLTQGVRLEQQAHEGTSQGLQW